MNTAVLRTEARLLAREPGSLFWILLFPSLLLAILGAVPAFREPQDGLGGLRIVDTYVPVTVLVGMIVAGVQAMPAGLTGYREHGILRRLSTTPVRPSALLSAQMLVHALAALLSALLALAVGRLAYDVRLPGQPYGYLLALVLAVLVALALGSVISAVSRTVRIAGAVGTAVFFPMLFSAGVWLPVQAMPDLMADIVGFTPFGAAAQALGQAMTGDWPGWSQLGVMAAWTLVLSVAAARWFRWE
ncbi:ABC transporter permease [Streptomyces viridochromogenes]|uniref:Transport permease protein n=1 Tax=Streptomyces viridochromogenes Tue57 TaxID=1160705 RepID=L8PGI9_STRVR|nr:ABC transporter permease [Streptomyces viridochromogenes]ELS56656.1 putative Integral membrane protein [Streptomyces viridochromogenes Tue57]